MVKRSRTDNTTVKRRRTDNTMVKRRRTDNTTDHCVVCPTSFDH
jgi:hypothetical protein